MFSGIVEESAEVVVFDRGREPLRLVVASKVDHASTQLGDSICIDGVCLTVVAKEPAGSAMRLSFDVAQETLRRSTIGTLSVGAKVNLERSLQLGGRLHGHFVFGHVDATATLVERRKDGNCDRLTFSFPSELRSYLATKGSVSLSGISLTVGEIEGNTFAVYIVPHTSEVTTLSRLAEGGKVNLEVDMLARYVHSALEGRGSAENRAHDDSLGAKLKRGGFWRGEAGD